MAKNGNPSRALELSAKALAIREQRRPDEPLKYAACCNDLAGRVGLTVLPIEKHCFSS